MRPGLRSGCGVNASADGARAIQLLSILTAAESVHAGPSGCRVGVAVPGGTTSVYIGSAISPIAGLTPLRNGVCGAICICLEESVIAFRHGVAPNKCRTLFRTRCSGRPGSTVPALPLVIGTCQVVVISLIGAATTSGASRRLGGMCLDSDVCGVDCVVAHDKTAAFSTIIWRATDVVIAFHEEELVAAPSSGTCPGAVAHPDVVVNCVVSFETAGDCSVGAHVNEIVIEYALDSAVNPNPRRRCRRPRTSVGGVVDVIVIEPEGVRVPEKENGAVLRISGTSASAFDGQPGHSELGITSARRNTHEVGMIWNSVLDDRAIADRIGIARRTGGSRPIDRALT